MSSIRLKNKKDIKDFFRILAEESIKEAKNKVLDMGASDLKAQSELDREAFKKIRQEQPEEVADDLDVSGFGSLPDDAASKPAEAEAEVEVEDTVEVEKPALDTDIEDVSLDSIAKKIDLMRSGKSVRDSATEERMRTYFDLLSEPERKALYAFISAVASMMTGEASGEEAADPSEPPYNVTMSSGDEDVNVEAEEEDVEEEEIAVEDTEEGAPDADADAGDEEEAETPIRVGGVQSRESISEIRSKVLSLLRKS